MNGQYIEIVSQAVTEDDNIAFPYGKNLREGVKDEDFRRRQRNDLLRRRTMLENIRLSFQGVWSHRLRSFLTMLGIIIGIAAIIAIVSTIKGTNEQIKKEPDWFRYQHNNSAA